MPKDEAIRAERASEAPTYTPAQRSVVIAVAAVLLLAWVAGVYWKTTLSMVSIWERSETFAHGYLVLPIFLYLVWKQRAALAAIEPRAYFPALLGLVAAGGAWMMGELLGATVVSQFAMVAMIPFAIWTVLGTRALVALGFPLVFLFFGVPFGEFMLPRLMEWTADFTIFAIRMSGVPIYREGLFFVIPSGSWSIVEGCSGLRYLIASLMIGVLFAYLTYRSPIRRAAFIVASLLVPLVANWLRAYIIVMLGHVSGNRIATGVDHLVYGWVFFGLVMLLLFWIGSRWREDDAPGGTPRQQPSAPLAPGWFNSRIAMGFGAALVVTAIWSPVAAKLDAVGAETNPGLVSVSGQNGWVAVSEELSEWRPVLLGADTQLRQTFAKGNTRVGLHIAFYPNQKQGSKAITTQNQFVRQKDPRWQQRAGGIASVEIGGRPFDFRLGVITDQAERLAAWQWFWVDGRVTTSEYTAIVYESFSLLQGRGDPAAWVAIYTPTEDSETRVRATLQEFTADMRGAIDDALRRAAGGQ